MQANSLTVWLQDVHYVCIYSAPALKVSLEALSRGSGAVDVLAGLTLGSANVGGPFDLDCLYRPRYCCKVFPVVRTVANFFYYLSIQISFPLSML